jgi:hypothetical protein
MAPAFPVPHQNCAGPPPAHPKCDGPGSPELGPFLLQFAKCTTPPERSMIARRRCYFRGRVLKSRQLSLHAACQGPMTEKQKGRGLASLEYLLRLDREAQRNFG